MLSFEAIKKKTTLWSGVDPIESNICPDSCIAFTGAFADLETCPYCKNSRWNKEILEKTNGAVKIAARNFQTFPLRPQIQALFRNPVSAKKLQYQCELTEKIIEELKQTGGKPRIYEDILHGFEYIQAVLKEDIKDNSIVFMSGMDGAQLYQHKNSDCWVYNFILLEYAPEFHYMKKHVLIGGIIPGPNKPKNYDSFMFPGFYHIAALQQEGLRIWDSSLNEYWIGLPYFIFAILNAVGSPTMSGMVGHHGMYGCQLFCGQPGHNKPNTPHYFPALLLPDDYPLNKNPFGDIDPEKIGISDPKHYLSQLSKILQASNAHHYAMARKDTGISRPSLLSGLSESSQPAIPRTFVIDLMHTATLNAGDLFLSLWRGVLDTLPSDTPALWPWAVLHGDIWKKHGIDVASATPYIPGSFDKAPQNIAENISSGYKAKEWQAYLYGLAPGFLFDILPFLYWKNYCQFVSGMRMIHQRKISVSDVQLAQKILTDFVIEFEHIYVQR